MLIKPHNIANLSDEELLASRICDLRIPVREVSLIHGCFSRLRNELRRKGLLVSPHLWVSDEWYSPDGVCGFAVPFYLLHPRLIRLAEGYLSEAEGSHRDWCMKLMRHEMGHVMDNAYRLRRRRLRQKLFGLSSVPYPVEYSPVPYSTKYVRNLDSWYAQAHPDEDWAETFAVWLNPSSSWRQKYKNTEARAKLDYMNEVMKSLEGVKPSVVDRSVDLRAGDITKTIQESFEEKRTGLTYDEVGFFDEDLKRIFSQTKDPKKPMSAGKFIGNYRSKIRDHVCNWTGHDRHKLKFIMDHMCSRCDELKLFLQYNSEETLLELTAMLTAKTASFLASGKYKITL
jgi:hypothetical protein